MAQGCKSPSGSYPRVLKPLTWHSFRVSSRTALSRWDPPGAPHVPRQLAHGEHSRRLRAGEAQRCCGDLGQVAQKVPNRTSGQWTSQTQDRTVAGAKPKGKTSPTVSRGARLDSSWSLVEHGPEDTPVKAKDLSPPPRTFPFVWWRRKRTGNAGPRIHLLNDEGTAVGRMASGF